MSSPHRSSTSRRGLPAGRLLMWLPPLLLAIGTLGGALLLPGEAEPDDPPPTDTRPNLLLISVDALRADHLGLHGYGRPTSPVLDRWARQAVVFERAYCPVPHTSFSITSLMTGKHFYSTADTEHPTLASVAREAGYHTAGFYPPAVFFIDRERFEAFERDRFGFEHAEFGFPDAATRVDQVINHLQTLNHRERFFIWVHIFDTHEPYRFRLEHDFGKRAIDRYDGEIAYVDRQLGRLFDALRRLHPHTYTALTADHGEAFGEHGTFYHGSTLNEEQVRVPAIVAGPGISARHVDGAVRTIDLGVTLLALAGLPVPPQMRGTDLRPWLSGAAPASLPPVLVELRPSAALIQGRSKIVHNLLSHRTELYDLVRDPLERNNLAAHHPDTARRAEQQLMRWITRHTGDDRALDSPSEVARVLARGRSADPGAVLGLMHLAQRHGQPSVRHEAVRSLTGLRPRIALPVLVAAQEDPDPAVRLAALVGAAVLGDGSSVRRLGRVSPRSLPGGLRLDGLVALAQARYRASAQGLVDLLRNTRDVYDRTAIIEALGRLGDAVAIPAILEQMDDLRTRRPSIDALGVLRARRAVPLLEDAVRSDRYITWRAHAARALGRIGDRTASAALQHAVKNDPEAAVVGQALLALHRLGGLLIPDLRALKATRPACDRNRVCTMTLDHHCAKRQNLVLLLTGDQPIEVYCGERRVGVAEPLQELDATPRPGQEENSGAAPYIAALVGLPALGGSLIIKTGPESRLVYAATRPKM